MRKLWILMAAVLMAALMASPALAHHVDDGGSDEAWSSEMNQESYWETRFASEDYTAECKKWQKHNGFIPAEYDAAVVKDGTMVRVYADLTGVGAFTSLGAINPANDKHFKAPHSWVMKCKFVDHEEPETAFWCVDGSVVESEEPPTGDSVTGPFDTAKEASEDCQEPEEPTPGTGDVVGVCLPSGDPGFNWTLTGGSESSAANLTGEVALDFDSVDFTLFSGQLEAGQTATGTFGDDPDEASALASGSFVRFRGNVGDTPLFDDQGDLGFFRDLDIPVCEDEEPEEPTTTTQPDEEEEDTTTTQPDEEEEDTTTTQPDEEEEDTTSTTEPDDDDDAEHPEEVKTDYTEPFPAEVLVAVVAMIATAAAGLFWNYRRRLNS